MPSTNGEQVVSPIATSDTYYVILGRAAWGNTAETEMEYWVYTGKNEKQIQTILIATDSIAVRDDLINHVKAHPDWYICFKDLDGDGVEDLKILTSNSNGVWEYSAYLWNQETGEFVLDEGLVLDTETHEES